MQMSIEMFNRLNDSFALVHTELQLMIKAFICKFVISISSTLASLSIYMYIKGSLRNQVICACFERRKLV